MGVNNISFNFLTLNDSDYEVKEEQAIDFLLDFIEQAFIQKGGSLK